MPTFYATTNPSDVREIDADTIAAWEASDNPKRGLWIEQPPAPTSDAIWQDEAWAIPPAPEPTPNWSQLKSFALTHPGLNAAMASALPLVPAAALALPAALMRAESGAVADFAGCWRAVCAAANPAPEVVAELVTAAHAANLPAEFVGVLAPELIRARDEQGRFIADDPATPRDEAWASPE